MASHDPVANEDVAEAAGLLYVQDDDPGIRRVKRGSGFSYLDVRGARIADPNVLQRIKTLAIPPAYTDVWICPSPRGHIQATGRDQRGRKQYRYHDRWIAARAETKFARMAAFGRALPGLRAQLGRDLSRPGLPREKVVATVVRLLEATLIRIGNDEYARGNKSFGLTTLRMRHVDLNGADLRFEFRGKSGVLHRTRLHDRRLAGVVRSIQELPGQRLFQYLDAEGGRHAVESGDVNAYIREVTGEDFSAKDFRTWGGTLAAAKALALNPAPQTAQEAKKTIALCVRATAGLLGNTPTVCRSAYIHPAVLQAFVDHRLPEIFAEVEGADFEAEVLTFLDALSEEVEAETGQTPKAQLRASHA
jgi:DNA topoisomerase-1